MEERIDCIEKFLESYELSPPTVFNAYLEHPIAHKQVKHIYTSSDSKQNNVENTMLVDVLQLTHKYDAPNVVILADNYNMARAVEILKMEGCRVYVVVLNKDKVNKWLASAAGPNLIAWDKWLEEFEDSKLGL